MLLDDCQKCRNHHEKFSSSAIIHVDLKPSLHYQVDQKWTPSKTNVLFIAESPPYYSSQIYEAADSYFYNKEEKNRFLSPPIELQGTLSWNLFSLLGIDNKLTKLEKLTQFMNKGYFYTESVKCRVDRINDKNLLSRTVTNCTIFLDKEISTLQPNTIVVMGEKALISIFNINNIIENVPSRNLNELMKVSEEEPIIINKIKFYFLPIPIWRNRKYLDSIQKIFSLIKKI
ncbi:MAG: hypothetical protein FK734_07665 [Asgard group archaeon]|nr:hypothetical protein [Asgard group archaeon]